MKNECAKTRKVNDPYEVWITEGFEYRVLKKYQTPEKEATNPYARWLCAVQGPGTFGSYDMGDTYVTEVTNNATKVDDPEEWCKTHPW